MASLTSCAAKRTIAAGHYHVSSSSILSINNSNLSSPTSLTKDLKNNEVPKYVAFGTNNSWYRCSKRKDAKVVETEVICTPPSTPIYYHFSQPAPAFSDNFPVQYPSLAKSLADPSLASAPTCPSLGPNGCYFAHIGRKRLWKLPKDMEERLGNLAEYEAAWLGKADKGPSYVAVRKGGGFSTDLQGNCSKLKEDIKAFGAPKVLALNLESGEEFVVGRRGALFQMWTVLIAVEVWPNGKFRSCSSKECLTSEEAVAFFEKVGFSMKASA
ncbi:uncharacterized protein LTR77_007272 [Saxophila tyrrhenica]|uniref:Uncharacterized protein n=1 Tax=Saxophila tyrrhenica TaxID=1690608 RepID=A0AAV9P477_9PEZI|nr:hypothetical protein LTR77_007272 [Saxophila tyrrhenica]